MKSVQNTPAPEVGLITLHLGTNFGSALQTFATWVSVKKAGAECTLIDYQYPTRYHLMHSRRGLCRWKRVFFACGLSMTNVLLSVKQLLNGTYFPLKRQRRAFRRFLAMIPKTKPVDRKSILTDCPPFDIYLTGSDQCWNPKYMYHDLSMLLNFAPDSARKISYSASFGSTQIEEEYREEYSTLLKRYDKISVREDSGREVVRDLTGRTDAEFVLDPTFLLDRAEWCRYAPAEPHPAASRRKFILCYILGYVFQPYPQINEMLTKISKMTGMPLVFLGKHSYDGPEEHLTIPDAGPLDFVRLMRDASFVVTTSFHGTAFAINFQKDFISVLNPNLSRDNRVVHILRQAGLENRGITLGENVERFRGLLKTDHEKSREKIGVLREKSLRFLFDALKMQ